MNSIEKQLFGFMGEAERMSGFDSYDSYDGYDDFEGNDDDMSYFDDDAMSYASGQQSTAMSDPYVIQYVSTALVTSDKSKAFTLLFCISKPIDKTLTKLEFLKIIFISLSFFLIVRIY